MTTTYYRDDTITLYTGDAIDALASLPDASVDCVVTSPPYWGLRDYGTGCWVGGNPACTHAAGRGTNQAQTKNPRVGYPTSVAHRGGDSQQCRRCGAWRIDRQYGLEPTPDDYVRRLRDVFTELHRVLAETGTVWLNLGDSYSAEPPGRSQHAMRTSTLAGKSAAAPMRESVRGNGTNRSRSLPRKNLYGIPWRVALALQEDGWILRNAIIWHKPNAMPESVKDRLSCRHETLFLLTKSDNYYFDLDSIREPYTADRPFSRKIRFGGNKDNTIKMSWTPQGQGKNPGDVWSISTRPLREAHCAPFPIDIPLRCIAAGCPESGRVLDPFSGAGTTGLAARQLGRFYQGIDLRRDYHDIALRRLVDSQPADNDLPEAA